MKNIFIFLSLFGFMSCSFSNKKTEEKSKYKTHSQLISCEMKFIMQDGGQADGYIFDHANFVKPYKSVLIKGDTIKISYLYDVTGCTKTIGDIKISNDTLYLIKVDTGSVACTEQNYYQFNYTIHNPERKNYIIVY